ncbi:LSU ribosomal protein L6P [Roseomonas mucosa]|jgi:large subunit ribosomal protein L6|uniref:Large ribosomal subunit protein uL6 n=1 Tax=Roseomonas mucosa TaxID=207340 RepID=A0A1S8D128_9PROT|nr:MULTISPECIES: 50S ribosomal protein L6 [Roseomonas]MBS5902511.1 50S ribosomal protein L6 [Acetobacteraceae bacterium]MDT8265986.1 50S ribosomal protein L6 [Roseomonas sp. DSM 102946]ATR22832.1 50S ribosomal protein L6 [Roseomonas sp. FDAARGOS_362]AWV24131.1 LSU ribosomal protein L6P [Roseomonas mucosa]MCG7352688.1 50S ribosomal protein L6 [Roseomonas mucosa]
MSRVGKYPVTVPSGVTVALQDGVVVAKGKLGELRLPVVTEAVDVKIEDGSVTVSPKGEDRRSRTLWGTTRSLINGMVTGVSTGFSKSMEITGTGYRAAVQGKELVLNLGYSHEIRYAIPEGIKITTERPTAIKVEGADKQRVGQVAAEIRAYRGPEPYKGKGVRYDNEVILRKEGKKK